MTKKFLRSELESVLAMWPEELDLSDALLSSTLADCAYFPELQRAWDDVNKRLVNNEVRLQLCWLVFGELHKTSIKFRKRGKHKISKSIVNQEHIISDFKLEN